jgi:putative ABC transport system permease protein
VLATIGIYATLAFQVAQRTREIGIRLALGAQPRAVMSLVLRRGFGLALAGLAIGVGASLALTRVLGRLLIGVGTTDAPTFAIATLGFAVVAFVACSVPALRATRVDPIQTLRADSG